MSGLTLLLLTLGPLGYGAGWLLGFGKGKELYAARVGELGAQIESLEADAKALEFEIFSLVSPAPEPGAAKRVLDTLSKGLTSDES